MNKLSFRVIINIVIAVVTFAAWLWMVFRGGGTLSSRGLRSLKYYTVLSNLFCAVIACIWLALHGNPQYQRFLAVLKYTGAITIFLTFLTVVFFLGPIFGYRWMFAGSNFWFHLVIPLLCAAEFIFTNTYIPTGTEKLAAVIPMLLYGCGYLGNILINGAGEGSHTNDWYGFTRWGLPVGVLIFVFLCAVVYFTGVLFAHISASLHH